jgi:hypothetical protein
VFSLQKPTVSNEAFSGYPALNYTDAPALQRHFNI